MPKVIGVKLTDEQLKRFEGASRRAHAKSVASWLRMLGQRATTPKAVREAEVAQSSGETVPHIPSAAEVAKSIVGVNLGFVQDLTRKEFEQQYPPADLQPEVFEIPIGTPARPWAEEIASLRKMEPDEARDRFLELLDGTKLPAGWKEWTDSKRAAWLDEHAPLATEEY
jgi:hypothetical protein